MEAKELRVGNYVKYNGHYLTVIGISPPLPIQTEKFNEKWLIELLDNGYITATIEEIEPVELTAEIIEKFGMVNRGRGHSIPLIKGNVLSLNLLSKSAIMNIHGPFGLVTPKHIKYLHQLQNIYFLLTDKELELIDGTI